MVRTAVRCPPCASCLQRLLLTLSHAAGDCRAVLGRKGNDGKPIALPLSMDHNAREPEVTAALMTATHPAARYVYPP